MSWKHPLILVISALNVLTLVLPGVWFVWTVLRDAGTMATTEWGYLFVVYGLLVIVMGVCNIACIQLALRLNGFERIVAVGVGCVSCCMVVGVDALGVMLTGAVAPLAIHGLTVFFTVNLLLVARRKPTPPGICPHCGYNLWGLPSNRCPECGKAGKRRR